MPPVSQRADGPGGIGPERIVQDQDPGWLSVDGDEDGECAVEPRPAARGLDPSGHAGHAGPGRPADGDPVRAHGSPDALPGHFRHLLRQHQPAAALGGRLDYGARENVPGHLVQRRCQPQYLGRLVTAGRDDRRYLRVPAGQGSGLVQQQCRAPGEPLKHSPALDHHPAPRRHRQPRDEGDRGGEDQRARGGDDQHRYRPLRPGHQPRGSGPGQAHQQEPDRVAVGKADKRRL